MGSNPRPDPAYVNLTRNVFHDLDMLFEAGEAVRALQAHPGWTHLSRLIEAEIASVEMVLDGRLLESRAAYAREHGRRNGLRAMHDAAEAIVAEADRKLAEQRMKYESTAESVPMGA